MTNYKQLCAELIDALDSGIPFARIRSSPLADQARAVLAEPKPEDPTDEEIMELMPQQMRDDLFRISECAISIKDSLRSLMIEVDDLLAIVIELEPQ